MLARKELVSAATLSPPESSTIRLRSAFLLVGANLLWAGQGTAIKLLNGAIDPVIIALLPLYAATLVTSVFLLPGRQPLRKLRSAWQFRREFFLLGISGQLTAQLGMTLGVSFSTAENGAILALLVPIFGAVISVWLLRERLTLLRTAVLLLGFAGVCLLSLKPAVTSPMGNSHQLTGNLLIAIGCYGSAFYNVYSKRLLKHFSGAAVLFFSYLTASLSSFPVLIAFELKGIDSLSRLNGLQWTALGYLSFLFYGLSMLFFFAALRVLDSVIASASLYLTPLFGVALAHIMLGEQLNSQTIFGSAIVLLATLLLFCFDHRFQDHPSPRHLC